MTSISALISAKDELMKKLKDNRNKIFYKELEIKDIRVDNEVLEGKLIALNKEIQDTCPHDWEYDSIDSLQGYKLAQPVKYCKICELTDLS